MPYEFSDDQLRRAAKMRLENKLWPKTPNEIVYKLAAMTIWEQREPNIEAPDGMWEVPRFPMLREPCPNYNATKQFIFGKGLTLGALRLLEEECRAGKDKCRGTGWIPLEPTVELAIAMLQSLHFHGVNLWWDGGEILAEGLWRGNMRSYPAGGQNPLEALWALVQKVAQKELL